MQVANARSVKQDSQPKLTLQFPTRQSSLQASRLTLTLKRLVDVSLSGVALLLLSPLMLAIIVLIKIDSPGPVLFRQKRWGQSCSVIEVLKFRTMRIELCDFSGVCQTVEHDPRVTRLGSILRSTNLDELPQLINVLRGDMSLVGPRCHAIGMLAAGMPYEELVPEYHIRHLVKPGITGVAQMKGLRGPTVDRDAAIMRFECDAYYVSNVSFWLDFKIMLETLRMEAFRGRGF